jgi:hypothetical protein
VGVQARNLFLHLANPQLCSSVISGTSPVPVW